MTQILFFVSVDPLSFDLHCHGLHDINDIHVAVLVIERLLLLHNAIHHNLHVLPQLKFALDVCLLDLCLDATLSGAVPDSERTLVYVTDFVARVELDEVTDCA